LPLLAALAAFVLTGLAEALHGLRVRRLARLVFGPRERPALWARGAGLLRALAAAALAWGLITLVLVEPKKHAGSDEVVLRDGDYKHVLLVLDVSPSMRLVDAGPGALQSRMQRARDVMESFFKRVPLEQYRISVVAVYNGAKPVVIDTTDVEVVRNILGDLPMHFAFRSGKTQLFEGLEEAVEIARPWNPRSTTLIVVSDGDTVPARGMPKMPASVSGVLVVGVGDPVTGKFIDGGQSRQNVSALRQIATRLGGTFHNGNERHLSSTLIGDLTRSEGQSPLDRLSRREYALLASAVGASVLAFLPLLLSVFGTRWRPGRRARGPSEGHERTSRRAGSVPAFRGLTVATGAADDRTARAAEAG
jgi:Ca-activated chloride channel family protein